MILEEKCVQALDLLRGVLDRHGPEHVRVAWTGGKDSTLVLHLWLQVLEERGLRQESRALSLDTGCKFPEVQDFRDRLAVEWGVDVAIGRPGPLPDGFQLAQDKATCCLALKVEPLKRAIGELDVAALISGIRRDEHPSRQEREFLEQRSDPEHELVNPILEFTEMDVWSCLAGQGLPWCELYDQGYRSLGCMPCTARPSGTQGAERQGRDPDKERILGDLTGLGYF